MVAQTKRDSPSLAFRYTVFATMFSNSINSSLIGFARPNRVGEEEASWSTSVGDVGGGRGGGREIDCEEYVRFLSHGVDEIPIRQAPICVLADTTAGSTNGPLYSRINEPGSAYLLDVSRCGSTATQGNLYAASDDSPFDRSTG